MCFGKIEVVFGTKMTPKTPYIRSFESTNFSNVNPTRVASPEIHPQKAHLRCIFNSPLRCFNVRRSRIIFLWSTAKVKVPLHPRNPRTGRLFLLNFQNEYTQYIYYRHSNTLLGLIFTVVLH